MLNFNFRKPKIADNFKRNRYDISNPDTLAHEGYKIIVLDEGELAVDANQQPIDAGYTVSTDYPYTFLMRQCFILILINYVAPIISYAPRSEFAEHMIFNEFSGIATYFLPYFPLPLSQNTPCS